MSMFPWCSGYHVSLTHSRSPVRSRVETLFALSPFYGDLYNEFVFMVSFLEHKCMRFLILWLSL